MEGAPNTDREPDEHDVSDSDAGEYGPEKALTEADDDCEPAQTSPAVEELEDQERRGWPDEPTTS